MRAEIFLSVPLVSRRRFARCLNTIRLAVPAATLTTVVGAPVYHATGGSANVAATDPSEMYRVDHTVTTNNPAAINVANGLSTANTPAATAIPLPP